VSNATSTYVPDHADGTIVAACFGAAPASADIVEYPLNPSAALAPRP
jgi:hypothetical protein